MEPILWPSAFADPSFAFQVKWDGVRCLAEVSSPGPVLRARSGSDLTSRFPELTSVLIGLEDCRLDGELVALGPDGKPSFPRILRLVLAGTARVDIPFVYMVFDLLGHRGEDLRLLPWEERQGILAGISLPSPKVRRVESHPGKEGEDLYRRCESFGLEGVVAKLRSAPYRAGKSRFWRKIKNPQAVRC